MKNNYHNRLHKALQDNHVLFFDYTSKKVKENFAHSLSSCPACGKKHFSLTMQKDWFKFSKCLHCGMIFLNPRLTDEATYAFYNSEWANIYNENKFYVASDSVKQDQQENRHLLNILLDSQKQHREMNLIEVGPGGEGTLLYEAQTAGYNITGIELGKENCRRLQERLGEKATIINSTLEKAKLATASFDRVVMRDVLEHIPNPLNFLCEVNRILKQKSLLLVQVPNIEGLIYKLSGTRHSVLFGFEHPNYWSPQSLSTVLQRAGFEVLFFEHESIDFTVKDISSYWFGESTHTTVFPRKRSRVECFLWRVLNRLLSLHWIEKADQTITPGIADKLFKRGSVIRVLAKKVTEATPQLEADQ